jgi:uncharacterized protein with GYD domain
MPTYITQGRYTREAIKRMIVRPEDRAAEVARLLGKVGGRLIGCYVTFGEYDFLSIAEAPNDVQMAAALLAAGGGGGVTDLKTTSRSPPSKPKAPLPPRARSRPQLQVGRRHVRAFAKQL